MSAFGKPLFPGKKPTNHEQQHIRIPVLGSELACTVAGVGRPIVFLQLGVASSYMWRRVVADLADLGQCIAIDLIGTGSSHRLVPSGRSTYTLLTHRMFLEACLEMITGGEPVVLVVHGLGSMVGFDWAARNPESVRAIVHMESIVRPATWADFEEPFRSVLREVRRDESDAFSTVADKYLEASLELEVVNPLPEHIQEMYRRRVETERYDKRAIITALNQIPISGEPSDAREVVHGYANWLRSTDVPKLLITGRPGYIHAGRMGVSASKLPAQTEVGVIGAHQLPEDSPDGVIRFMRSFIKRLEP